MTSGRIQAKDIDDRAFLMAVYACQLESKALQGSDYLPWATWAAYDPEDQSVEAVAFRKEYGLSMEDYFPKVPRKVLQAKGSRLIDRDLMTGCMCGCRGDMEITERGLLLIESIDSTASEVTPMPPSVTGRDPKVFINGEQLTDVVDVNFTVERS